MPPNFPDDGLRGRTFASISQSGPPLVGTQQPGPISTTGTARPRRPTNNNNGVNTNFNTNGGESQTLVITTTATNSTIPSDNRVIKNIRGTTNNNKCYTILALCVLVGSWIVCFAVLLAKIDSNGTIHIDTSASQSIEHVLQRYKAALLIDEQTSNLGDSVLQQPVRGAVANTIASKHDTNQKHQHEHQQPHLVSRLPNKVIATADVRGNLGPAPVVIQAKGGDDWLHDRWQAASNMHGKNIPGEHWIQLEFEDTTVVATTIVLDWETAYADEYLLEASMEPFSDNSSNNLRGGQNDSPWVLFDGRDKEAVGSMLSVETSGKSPGVKEPMPLHVVHTIELAANNNNNDNSMYHKPFKYLRLHILKSNTGWGVSLWQFDVYGFRTDELQTSR